MQTGVWCLGEYADLLVDSGDGEIRWNDILELFSRILIHPSSTTITKACVLTALTKLPARIPDGNVTEYALGSPLLLHFRVALPTLADIMQICARAHGRAQIER